MKSKWLKKISIIMILSIIVVFSLFEKTVKAEYVSIYIDPTKIIIVGESVKLDAMIPAYKGMSKKEIKWKTSNKNIVSVKNGKITGISKGKATITATFRGKKSKCKVTVQQPTVREKELEIAIGEKTFVKIDGTTRRVKWKSENEDIAKVKNGTVTGISEGICDIVGIIGGQEFICTVTVKDLFSESAIKNNLPYTIQDTKGGMLIIFDNKYTFPINVNVRLEYYLNGEKIRTETNQGVDIMVNKQAALCLQKPESRGDEITYDDYKLILSVKREEAGLKYIESSDIETSVLIEEASMRNYYIEMKNNSEKDIGMIRGCVVGYGKNDEIKICNMFFYGDILSGNKEKIFFHTTMNVEDVEDIRWEIFINCAYSYK